MSNPNPNESTRFKPGQSGNPAGKPPGTRSFTTKVREALEKIAEGKDYTYEEAFIKSIMKKAIVDQDPTIMRLIWNYLDGMPMQSMDLKGKVDIMQIVGTKIIEDGTPFQNENKTTNTSGESVE